MPPPPPPFTRTTLPVNSTPTGPVRVSDAVWEDGSDEDLERGDEGANAIVSATE
jgi:hypothetical protein